MDPPALIPGPAAGVALTIGGAGQTFTIPGSDLGEQGDTYTVEFHEENSSDVAFSGMGEVGISGGIDVSVDVPGSANAATHYAIVKRAGISVSRSVWPQAISVS